MAKKTDIFLPDRIVEGRFVTARVKALLHDMEGCNVEVCIRPRRSYTSVPQHRYYRGVVVAMIGDHLRAHGIDGPHGGPITDEQVHAMLAHRFLRATVLIDPDTGECMDIVKSTAALTTAEISDYWDQVRKWAAETLGLFIPDPEQAKGVRLAR